MDRIPRIVASLLALTLIAVGGTLVGPTPPAAAFQDGEKKEEGKAEEKKEEPAPPSEDEAKEFLKEYEKGLKKMTDEDAMAGVEKLKGWYVNSGTDEKLKKKIIGAVKKVCDQRAREALLESTAKSLASFGEDGVGLLQYLVGRAMEQKVPAPGVVRAGLSSLGKIASVRGGAVKFLTDLLKKDDEFIGDAARALSGYAKAPGAIRRDIFEELLKMSEGVFSKSENNDQPAKRRWNIWGTEVVDSMQKVTGTSWTKPTEFRKWFNDKGEGGGKNPRTWMDQEDGK